MDSDVIVVGAGLSGLNAARTVAAAGRSVIVLEAGPTVGGRVQTDRVDGFLLDRGFQLFNPAYTEARRALDLPALDLRRFGRGVAVRDAAGSTLLADPARHPRAALAALGSPYLRLGDLTRFGGWAVLPRARGRDSSTAFALDRAGVTGPLRSVVEVFLAGVLADLRLDTSAAFTRELIGWFLRGTPSVPAGGMGVITRQLALGLDVRTSHRVTHVSRQAGETVVETESGRVSARRTVLAVDPPGLAALTGADAAPMRGLETWWFATDEPPTALPFLFVDADRRGPIVNTAVMTNVAAGYAPAGQSLVQCSMVLAGAEHSEADVRRHAGTIYGRDAASWRLLRRDLIPHSLPAMLPGVRPSVALGDGLELAGDLLLGGSIQGAMASGRQAAERALQAWR